MLNGRGYWFGVLAASLVCGTALAEIKDEPADFRGVQWDESFDVAGAKMSIVRDEGDIKYYIRKEDVLKIGQVDALKVAYRYYKGKFGSGVIQTYGGANQKALLATLTSMYGDPLRPRKRISQYFWDGAKVYIVLTCEVTSYCVVEINSKDVIQREQADTGLVPTYQKDND